MMFLNRMISGFDALILRLTPDGELKNREKESSSEVHSYDSSLSKFIRDAYASVDIKATAVLQHVSIMIAVTGILYSQANGPVFKWLFGAETLLYVVLALFCLRLLMAQHHAPNFGETTNVAAKEATLELTAKFTFLISILLIITVLVELVVR
jgi:hypothetical protein